VRILLQTVLTLPGFANISVLPVYTASQQYSNAVSYKINGLLYRTHRNGTTANMNRYQLAISYAAMAQSNDNQAYLGVRVFTVP
jgi:hypothetical protein